jgi:hypothetical protein
VMCSDLQQLHIVCLHSVFTVYSPLSGSTAGSLSFASKTCKGGGRRQKKPSLLCFLEHICSVWSAQRFKRVPGQEEEWLIASRSSA